MEKWARNFQLIINKRDTLLKQLNEVTGNYYTYLSIKHLSMNDLKTTEARVLFSQLKKAMDDYDKALVERDQKMFGKFLDSIINEKKPTAESQDWCANQF